MSETSPHPTRHLARLVFFVFSLTFIASRVLVILIMLQKVPDMFLHMGGTHVHHLNYGIFLLSTVGGLLLFAPMTAVQREYVACLYGFGMALTFDEFGMWLHLGGSYFQRASYDAVIVLASLLGMLAYAPSWKRVGTRHLVAVGITVVGVGAFAWLSFASLNLVDRHLGDELREIEVNGPK